MSHIFKHYNILGIKDEVFELKKKQILQLEKQFNRIIEDINENKSRSDLLLYLTMIASGIDNAYRNKNLSSDIRDFIKRNLEEWSNSELPNEKKEPLFYKELLNQITKWKNRVRIDLIRELELKFGVQDEKNLEH